MRLRDVAKKRERLGERLGDSLRDITKKNCVIKILRINLIGLFMSISVISLLLLFIEYSQYYSKDMSLYIYTISITIFQMSIISSSFLYKKNKFKNEGYEPYVTFVIPVKNEEKVIFETIKRCYDVNYSKNKIEVIVINDGSTDDTWKEIERAKKVYPVRAINWEKNKGKKFGMAEGFRKAKGEIVIQLDSDSYIHKDRLKYLIQPLKEDNIGAVCAHTDPENKSDNILTKVQAAYYFMAFRALKATESLFETVFCCSGCCSAYKKTKVLPILDEWLNEKFFSKLTTWDDDRSLTNLLLKSKYKTVYASEAQAFTIVPSSFKQLIKQQIRWKKSWIVSSIRASKFVWRRDKFVAGVYFYPLLIMTILNPIIVIKALIIDPIIFKTFPIFYFIGIILINAFLVLHYNIYRKDKHWIYMLFWIILDNTILSFVMIYALFDLKNLKWGTR